MKKNLLLLLVFIALAGLAFWLWRGDRGSTITGAMSDFAVPDTAAIDRIFIADKQGKTIDLRRDGSGWTVNGIPAKTFQVNTLLKTFIRVEVRTPVPMSMRSNVLKAMSTLALKVEIYTGGSEPEKIWWVGHGTPDHFGVFCVLEKPDEGRSDSPFVLGMAGFTGMINTRFHTRLDEWRSTDVAIYPDPRKVTRVTVEHPSTDSAGFTIEQNDGRFRLLSSTGAELPIDTMIARDLFTHLRDAHFEYFERTFSKAQQDSTKATEPWHVLTIESSDGKSLRIPFWRKQPYAGEKDVDMNLLVEDVDRMHALIEDTALVVVQRYWFDRMVPYLSQVRAKR